MPDTPLNPDDEARLKKALEQSANGQVVSRGSFAQYAQPPLNPDALEAAADAVTMAAGACGVELYGADEDIFAERAVSAYLAAALPEVTSVEELEALPQGSVIRSVVFGVVRERFDSGWLATGGEGFDQSSDIAGRAHVVLYRPEANDA